MTDASRHIHAQEAWSWLAQLCFQDERVAALEAELASAKAAFQALTDEVYRREAAYRTAIAQRENQIATLLGSSLI